MKTDKKILDACCGSRMFWFDKENPEVLFADIRDESHELCDGRQLEIKPDVQCDFRDLPFEDCAFKMVVFDPPHLHKLGQSSWMAKKYGVLNYHWRHDIKQGFDECMRVLDFDGTLIFKWNEDQIPAKEVLKVIDKQPLFGHTSGQKTKWFAFLKLRSINEH